MNQLTPLRFLLTTAGLLTILIAGYYWLAIKPRLNTPAHTAALTQFQQILAQDRNILTANRIALVTIAKLNSTTANFEQSYASALQALQQTNETIQSINSDSPNLPSLEDDLSSQTSLINEELPAALRDLRTSSQQIMTKQQQLINQLTITHTTLENLYRYDPLIDLGQLTPASNHSELVNRANAAVEGLTNIRSGLAELPANVSSADIATTLTKLTDQLTTLIQAWESQEDEQASRLLDEITISNNRLRQRAFAAEKALIRSDASVENLADQTNLIHQYDTTLNQLSLGTIRR